MLAWFRARSRSLSALALASLTAVAVQAVLPHWEDCHDADFGQLKPHDPDGHRVAGPTGDREQPFHCLFCHLTRAFHRPPGSVQPAAPVAQARSRALAFAFRAPHDQAAAQPPLRAPPSHA